MTKPRPGASRSNAGRPPAVTPEVLTKLESAFAIGATDIEACLFADILVESLYLYQRKNPEYIKRKEMLKQKPILKARNTVANALNEVDTAKWYLERKKKDEFSLRNELTGADGASLTLADLIKKNAN